MTQQQVDPNAVIHALSEQIRQMSVDHAIALAAAQAAFAELREENEALKTAAVSEMDAKEDE